MATTDVNIGIVKTGVYFPPGIETAYSLAQKTVIPEHVIIEKFGLNQKHVSDETMHATDMAIEAAKEILTEIDPTEIDVIIYFGSPFKDYNVWSGAAKIQHLLGATNAYAFEMMNVSACFPIALKVAKDMLIADDEITRILLVGGCKESHILDYENPRSRFMFNFADGGAAALIQRGGVNNTILRSSIVTDGSFYDDVKMLTGGSIYASSTETIDHNPSAIDVKDPSDMKGRLDKVSDQNFLKVVREAVEKSGYQVEDIDLLLPLHTKKSIFLNLLTQLGLTESQAIYLDDYGHLSALDPCIGLHLAHQQGKLTKGSLVVTVSAGTGYTWSATAVIWNQ